MTTWPLQRDCTKFYGDPRGANDKASAKREREHLVLVKCPWELRFEGKSVSGIRIHKKCAESLARVLTAIWERVGRSQAEIDRIGMSVYGGSYSFRAMRGGKSLSMHSYGCALDFDPARNGFGNRNPAMDRRVIEEFEREGWEWGGHWSRPDGMHFQAARTKAEPNRLAPVAPVLVAAKPPPLQPQTTPPSDPAAYPSAIYRPEVERPQAMLKDLGYHEVGLIDGRFGSKTRGALLAFKADNGLPLTATIDDGTWAALARAKPRQAPNREDIAVPPSAAAEVAQYARIGGAGIAAVGALDAALEPADGIGGIIGWLTDAGEVVGVFGSLLQPFRELALTLAGNWPFILIITGATLFFAGRRVFRDELESFRKGEWS